MENGKCALVCFGVKEKGSRWWWREGCCESFKGFPIWKAECSPAEVNDAVA